MKDSSIFQLGVKCQITLTYNYASAINFYDKILYRSIKSHSDNKQMKEQYQNGNASTGKTKGWIPSLSIENEKKLTSGHFHILSDVAQAKQCFPQS